MASAYTPGLKIVARTLVEKDRKLPLRGRDHVKKGDKVTDETVVASTDLPVMFTVECCQSPRL
jgi:hypothetical protein